MDPGSVDANLALQFLGILLWAVIWLIGALFVAELMSVVILCCQGRKRRDERVPSVTRRCAPADEGLDVA